MTCFIRSRATILRGKAMMSRQQSDNVPTSPFQSNQNILKAVVVENFRVMGQPKFFFPKLNIQFKKRELHIQETEHFLFARNPRDKVIILVHTFLPTDLDNNVGYYLMQELTPFGLIKSENAFGALLVGIVVSTNLNDPISAWGQFSLNTLAQIKNKIYDSPQNARLDFITSFAYIYQRLFALKVGSELLDVGCACAFWPILVAQTLDKIPQRIVGVDNRQDAINLSMQLASLTNTTSIEFLIADVLASEFLELGVFDTVTVIHLLEHIPEIHLPLALSNLLQVTRYRLLIAVPYEEQPELAYGHEQVFNREKLEAWGQWCIKQLDGKGRAYCEDVQGGLLVIEKFSHSVGNENCLNCLP